MPNKDVVPALRVAQLDASELDDSCINLLSTYLQACFKYKIGNLDLMQIEPHLRTAMYAVLLHWTLWQSGQTIGQKLLRLRYGDGKTLAMPSKQKLLLLQGILVFQFWRNATKSRGSYKLFTYKYIQGILKIFEASFSVLNLLNFLFFLKEGRFQSLIHRIAGLRSVYVDSDPRQRMISLDLMSRDFLWHGFAECAVFFLSLVNVAKLRRSFSEFFFPKVLPDDHEDFDNCAFCDKAPIMPYQGACHKHAYCYYCVAASLDRDQDLKCPSCKLPVESIRPLPCRDVVLRS